MGLKSWRHSSSKSAPPVFSPILSAFIHWSSCISLKNTWFQKCQLLSPWANRPESTHSLFGNPLFEDDLYHRFTFGAWNHNSTCSRYRHFVTGQLPAKRKFLPSFLPSFPLSLSLSLFLNFQGQNSTRPWQLNHIRWFHTLFPEKPTQNWVTGKLHL